MESLSFRGRFKPGLPQASGSSDYPYKANPTKRQAFKASRMIKKLNLSIILTSLVCWLAIINYYERSTVKKTIKKCLWSKWEEWTEGDPHRVALFADPQIMDAYSYPGRPVLVNFFARQLIDNYHRRNWQYVKNVLDADTTIFLGDLFDGGRNWNDSDWFTEFERFNSIYDRPANKRTIMSLPGNHDIGFGETVNIKSLQRFQSIFGPTSSIHDIGNHTLVLLDTISLTADKELAKHPRQVLDSLAPYSVNEKPRILMSHVPLYRFPDQQPCGPLRESSKKFPIMKGEQYQTVIDYEVSKEVLSKIRPKIAFSGDDHDYCHVTHTYQFEGKDQQADEITVKSCSMNMGIRYPAIQLLSLNTGDPSSSKSYQTEICYLPPPYTALKSYIATVIINFIIFLVIFLLPRFWNFLTHKALSYVVPNHRYSLPVAEVTKPSPVSISQQERDLVGLAVNSVIVIVGVLAIFTVYYSAV